MDKIIHIVFSESAACSFRYAVDKKKSIVGDKVIGLYDDLSTGDISDLRSLEKRELWWKEINKEDEVWDKDIEALIENYYLFYSEILKIDKNDTVYLWHGNSNEELCGVTYALSLLKNKSLKLYTVNVFDMVIEKNNVVYIARTTGEIPPGNLGEYLKVAKEIGGEEYDTWSNQWDILVKENSMVRSYRNGKVESVSDDYFDKDILKYTETCYKKSARIVGEVLGHVELCISDEFVFWRIKELIKCGKINFSGKFGIMREMEICISEKGLEYLSSDSEIMGFWQMRKEEKGKDKAYENYIKDEARLEEQIRITKNLLDVLDVETIASKTGLTVGQVRGLYEENNKQ